MSMKPAPNDTTTITAITAETQQNNSQQSAMPTPVPQQLATQPQRLNAWRIFTKLVKFVMRLTAAGVLLVVYLTLLELVAPELRTKLWGLYLFKEVVESILNALGYCLWKWLVRIIKFLPVIPPVDYLA